MKNDFPRLPGVYKWTNKINGKVYIGKGVQLRKRINSYTYYADLYSNTQTIYKAIKKYGVDNFEISILETYPKRSPFIDNYILHRESFWIKFYRATDRRFGYNFCEFSTDRTGTKQSQSFIDKITEVNTKMVHLGRCRPVQQIDPKSGKVLAEFYSANHASITLCGHGDLRSKILEVAKGRVSRKSCYGYIWKFKKFTLNPLCQRRVTYEYVIENFDSIFLSDFKENYADISNHFNKKRLNRRKKVLQFSKDGKDFIGEFSCKADACLHLGIGIEKTHNISSCARGKNKTSYGFVWRYK